MSPDPKNEHELERYKELEIKIGFAQEAAGNNIEAIESFQRIITKYFGHSFPASEFRNKYRGIISMLAVIFKLNFPSFYFRKVPDEKFDLFMKMVTQYGEAMTSLNPRLFFLQMNYFLKVTTRYDLSRSMPGLSFFIESVALFMWTGISFTVSKKMIDYARNAGVENHPSSLMDFRFIKRMYDFHVGNLEEEKDFEEIYRIGMHIGDFFPTTIYALYSGMVSIAKGNYQEVAKCVKRLEEISESFDNSHARAQSYRLSSLAHSQLRMPDLAISIADEGIRYTSKTGHFAMLLVIWCAKSMAHSAKNETEEAKKALLEAEKLVAERKIMTIYYLPYLQAKAQVEYSALKSKIEQDLPGKEQSKAVLETVNILISQSKKMRTASVAAYRLKAMVYWMLKKQNKTFKYFILSIKAGQKYNCRLELARTYFEAGKCLRETGSIKNSLMGVIGSEYLLKARNLFKDMDLQHDLQIYERYIEG
jgi:tetratricopeptide (TPR) repeat protein